MLTCAPAPAPAALVASAEGLLFAFRDGSVSRLGPDGALTSRPAEPVVALGVDEEGVLMARDDGRVGRITGDLRWTDLGEVPQPVTWIGGGHGAVLVAVQAKDRTGIVEGFWPADLLVLNTGARWPLEHGVRTGLVVSDDQAWVGADYGEFGGWITEVDLDQGPTDPTPAQARGLLTLPDGGTWAYGGLAHMLSFFSTLSRLDEPSAGDHRATVLPSPRARPIDWMATDGQRTWARQRDHLLRLDDGVKWTPVRWRGGPIATSAHVGDHLVLVSRSGVIADLYDRPSRYRCLDGSEPRRERP